jgi:transcriptional regulator with XRE-family HTH domain
MQRTLGSRLAQARITRGLTQAALAAKSHVPHAMMVSAWERGRNLPRIDYLVAIARVLHVSVDWLCGLGGRGRPTRRSRTG